MKVTIELNITKEIYDFLANSDLKAVALLMESVVLPVTDQVIDGVKKDATRRKGCGRIFGRHKCERLYDGYCARCHSALYGV